MKSRWIWITLLVLAVAGTVFYFVRDYVFRTAPPSHEAIAAQRRGVQAARIRHWMERRQYGTFLPQGDVTVAIREDFLQRVLSSSMPIRQSFLKGRFVAQLDSVRVDLRDGVIQVRLTGRGISTRDTTRSVGLALEGELTVVGVDSTTGEFAPRFVITDVRALRQADRNAPRNAVIRYFGYQKMSDWDSLQSAFRLPLKVSSVVNLPAVHGEVELPAASVPLNLQLSSVVALVDRLVISVHLQPEADSLVGPQPPSPASGVMVEKDIPPADEAAVEAWSDSLRAFAATDSLWRAIALTDRDLIVITPRVVLNELVTRVATRYRRGVGVNFKEGIHAKVDQQIKVKMLGRKVGVGRIKVDVDVKRLQGRLTTPDPPNFDFKPPDRLELTLPVRIVQAGGTAAFDAAWDPAAIVSVACRGFQTHLMLTASVRPLSHAARADVHFKYEDGKLLGQPRVVRDPIRLSFELTDSSWASVRKVFQEQDKFGKCGVAMNPDSMVALLRRFGNKGINVRLPEDLIPDFELPVSFSDVEESGSMTMTIKASNPEILVREEYLRFGLDGTVRVAQRRGQAGNAPSSIDSSRARP